jgi:hypothetical protein
MEHPKYASRARGPDAARRIMSPAPAAFKSPAYLRERPSDYHRRCKMTAHFPWPCPGTYISPRSVRLSRWTPRFPLPCISAALGRHDARISRLCRARRQAEVHSPWQSDPFSQARHARRLVRAALQRRRARRTMSAMCGVSGGGSMRGSTACNSIVNASPSSRARSSAST